ncbi:MAG: Fic family protein [Actinobacteria bacterium]|nr:Fic family protein [Actinomycetota bacterium]
MPITEGGERGREEIVTWNGAPVRAWIPDPLASQDFEVGVRTARRTEQALAAVRVSGGASARFEPLASLSLRAEGVASSYIEGLRMPLADVAAAEVGDTSNATAAWVADNLAAVRYALDGAERNLTIEDIQEWHRRLMGPAGRLPKETVGAFRTTQSWIGGTSPRSASFVPPPPERVDDLMVDLVGFVNAEGVDPITQAAVAHAQFETVHPYGDGNGRIGRILIGWILAHRTGITVPPPVSVFIARDPGGYLAGMTRFRLGELDPWVEWLAAELQYSSEATQALLVRSEQLLQEWSRRIDNLRADATARLVLPLIFEHPVVSSDLVAARVGVSERAARAALALLAERGILELYKKGTSRPGRPRSVWVASELIAMATNWSPL